MQSVVLFKDRMVANCRMKFSLVRRKTGQTASGSVGSGKSCLCYYSTGMPGWQDGKPEKARKQLKQFDFPANAHLQGFVVQTDSGGIVLYRHAGSVK